MKRILSILAVVALVTMTAQAVQVKSQNIAGVINVTIPGSAQYTLVALNLDAFDPADQNIEGVFGSQLRAAASPVLADKIHIYDPSTTSYKKYARKSSTGLFHDVDNWTAAATNAPLQAGQAFWVQSGTGLSELSISLTGQAVEASSQATGIVTGYQMGGYPFSCARDANLTGLTSGTSGLAPTLCDRLFVWNPDLQDYDRYGLRTSVGWVDLTDWNGGAVDANIPLGVGFWYDAKNPFTWNESRPYDVN